MPQKSPGSLRSSRKRALEIGTNAAGFDGGLDIDVATGSPGAVSTGQFKGNATHEQTHGSGSHPQPGAPFKVGQ